MRTRTSQLLRSRRSLIFSASSAAAATTRWDAPRDAVTAAVSALSPRSKRNEAARDGSTARLGGLQLECEVAP